MSEYQKVIRGRGSLSRLSELMMKFGMRRPLIVGTEPLISVLMKKNPSMLSCPVFSGFHPNPDLSDFNRRRQRD